MSHVRRQFTRKAIILIAIFIAIVTALLVIPQTGEAAITASQAQSAFNQQVKNDAGEGLTWKDCGSLHPLITHTSNGWVAEGDYVYRGRVCGISTQVCYWKGLLADNGTWLEHRKWNCR